MWFTPLLQGAAQQQAAAAGPAAFYIPPKRWTRQPQGAVTVDWSNPLTRGLVICTHAGNNFRELVTNKPSTITSATSAPTKEGRALMDSASTFSIETPVTADFGDAVTWFFLARPDGTGGGGLGRFIDKRTAAVNTQVEVLYFNGALGQLFFDRISAGGVNQSIYTTTSGMVAGNTYAVAARVGAFTSNADAALFVNGSSKTLSTNTAGTVARATNAANYVLGNRTNDNARNFDGRMYCVYRWNRALSDAEIQSISANPYQIFQPTQAVVGAFMASSVKPFYFPRKLWTRQPQGAVEPQTQFGTPDLIWTPATERKYGWSKVGNPSTVYRDTGVAAQHSGANYLTNTKTAKAGAVSFVALVRFNDFGNTFGSNPASGATIVTQRLLDAEKSPTLVASDRNFASSSTSIRRIWFGLDTSATAVGRSNSTAIELGKWYAIAAAADANGVTGVAVNGLVENIAYTTQGTWNSNWTGTNVNINYHPLWPTPTPVPGDIDIALLVRYPRTLSWPEMRQLTKTLSAPWQVFRPRQPFAGAVVVSSVSISRPNADITVTGWSASTGSDLYAMLDESVADDGDYIISPEVGGGPGPAIFSVTPTQPAGSVAVRFRARRTGTAGQIRVLLQDASGNTIGTSTWQSLTSSLALYSLTVTTTGITARVRLEVQT